MHLEIQFNIVEQRNSFRSCAQMCVDEKGVGGRGGVQKTATELSPQKRNGILGPDCKTG